jgi:hypothetical protein
MTTCVGRAEWEAINTTDPDSRKIIRTGNTAVQGYNGGGSRIHRSRRGAHQSAEPGARTMSTGLISGSAKRCSATSASSSGVQIP